MHRPFSLGRRNRSGRGARGANRGKAVRAGGRSVRHAADRSGDRRDGRTTKGCPRSGDDSPGHGTSAHGQRLGPLTISLRHFFFSKRGHRSLFLSLCRTPSVRLVEVAPPAPARAPHDGTHTHTTRPVRASIGGPSAYVRVFSTWERSWRVLTVAPEDGRRRGGARRRSLHKHQRQLRLTTGR